MAPTETSVKYLRVTAVWRKEAGEITVFAINRAAEEMDFESVLGNFAVEKVVSTVEIHHDSLDAVNTETEEQVRPAEIDGSRYSLAGNVLQAQLKPYSWNMFRVKVG